MSLAHWVYIACALAIIVLMVMRKNIVVPAIAGTFITVLVYTASLPAALASIFNAISAAGVGLFTIFVVVAIVRGLFMSLEDVGADKAMAAPFVRLMKRGWAAFWVLGVAMWLFSLLFWPTPALALVGAVLLPVALKAGVPPITAAAVIAVGGAGMASSDYVLRAGPGISAASSGAPVEVIADRAFVLALIAGLIALTILFIGFLRNRAVTAGGIDLEPGSASSFGAAGDGGATLTRSEVAITTKSRAIAIIVAVVFLLLIVYMFLPRFTDFVPDSRGIGTGLVASVALILIIPATLAGGRREWLERSAGYLSRGLVFSFKAMGAVIPIAGFFFLGISEYSAQITGVEDAPGFLIDAVSLASAGIPADGPLAAIAVSIVGLVAGLDGSGFANLPLTGGLAQGLAAGSVNDAATLAAVGQMSTLWSGGGALVPWSSLVAVASIVGVNVLDVARKTLVPSLIAILVAAVLATIIF
ncbi:MAG: hypothetical protein QM602_04265 [Microbacterium sp.]